MTNMPYSLRQWYQGVAFAAGMAALAGCDTEKRIGLDELVLQGPVKVQLIHQVLRGNTDICYLEVYDNTGKLRARNVTDYCRGNKLPWGTIMVHDDGRVYKRIAGDETGFVKER